MVGVFINTVPVRVGVGDETEPLIPWLVALQADQARRRDFEHVSLVDVQGWSEIPRGTPLFESLFVFENYPSLLPDDSEDEASPDRMGIEDVRSHARTN